MSDKERHSLLALRQIAAVAEKAADDLQNHRMWPGDLSKAKSLIAQSLQDVVEENPNAD